jgi:hypothetical protein
MKRLLALAILLLPVWAEASLITPDSPWGTCIFGGDTSWTPSFGEVLDSAKTAGFSWIRINGIPNGWHPVDYKDAAERAKPCIEALIKRKLNIVVTWVPDGGHSHAQRDSFWKCMVEVFDGDGEGYTDSSGNVLVDELAATVDRPVQYWKIMTESNVCGPVNRNVPYQPVHQLSDYGITDSCLHDSVEGVVSPIGHTSSSVLWNWFKLYQQALNDLAHYIETSANAIHGTYPEAKIIAPSFHMVDLAFWIQAVDAYGNPGKVGFFYYPDGAKWSDELTGTNEHRRKYWHNLLSFDADSDGVLLGEEIDVIGAHYSSVWEWRRTREICREWYVAHGISPKPFWVMEIGGDDYFANDSSGELRQATYYRDTFTQWLDAMDAGEFNPKEDKVFVFTLWHYDVNNYGGLLYHDDLKPKTAYYAMRNMIYGNVGTEHQRSRIK